MASKIYNTKPIIRHYSSLCVNCGQKAEYYRVLSVNKQEPYCKLCYFKILGVSENIIKNRIKNT